MTSWITRLFGRNTPARRETPPSGRARLTIESLEHRLVPASISGTVFLDPTGDGFSPDDVPAVAVPINLYLDGGNGVLDAGALGGDDEVYDPRATNASGVYRFHDLGTGLYFVVQDTAFLASQELTQTAGGDNFAAGVPFYSIQVSEGSPVTDRDFANGNPVNPPGPSQPPVIDSFTSTATFAQLGRPGQAVTIRGTFTDPDLGETYTALVDYGDGTPAQSVVVTPGVGGGTFTGTHVYANGGVFAVTVTLSDGNGGTDAAATQSVVTGIGVNDGVLQIVGTNSNDTVRITLVGRVNVVTNFGRGNFSLSSFDRIQIFLGGGNDRAFISPRIRTPALIVGGDGNDVLSGGGGRDVLIGGRGFDRIDGNGGEDLLVSGFTAHDQNAAALDAILREWRSPSAYATRVSNIRSGAGSILGGIGLSAAEVFDDGRPRERLIGGSGRDVYFFAPTDTASRSPGEQFFRQ